MDDVGALCLSCHSDMESVTTAAGVKPDATIKDKALQLDPANAAARSGKKAL